MLETARRYRYTIALILIGVLVIVCSRLIYAPSDDAYIFLVYAKNWLSGSGPTFNGTVVEGFSSPLWLGLLILFGLSGIPLPTVMQMLSTASGMIAIFAVYRLTVSLSHSRTWGVLAALLLASVGDFVFYTGVGLEEVLFAALLALAAAEIAADAKSASSGFRLPLLLALSILTRPEGALFAAMFLLWGWASTQNLRLPFRAGMWTTAMLAPVLIAKRLYYGYWLPNTFYIKSNAGLANLTKGKIYLAQNAPRYAALIGLLLLVGIAALSMKRWTQIRQVLPLLMVSGIWGVYLLLSGGDNLAGGRVLLPALPLVLSSTAALMAVTIRNWRYGLVIVLLVGAANAYAYAQDDLVQDHLARWRRNFPVRQAAGLHLKNNFPADTLVALNPAGIIPYYSELPTIDMLGLNDEVIAHFGQRDFSLDFGHQAGDGEYVLSRQPDVILFGGGVARQPGDLVSDRQIAESLVFQREYRQVTWPGIGYAFVRISE